MVWMFMSEQNDIGKASLKLILYLRRSFKIWLYSA
jgi:hypothetical protein